MPSFSSTRSLLLGLAATPLWLAAAGCEGSIGEGSALPEGCTVLVAPGEDDHAIVQEALIETEPGDLVCFDEGVYSLKDELSLSTPEVTLRARGEAILDFTGQVAGANALLVTADDFVLEGLTIKNMSGDGVRMNRITGVEIRDVHIYWDLDDIDDHGDYGLYPVGVTDILIEDSRISGAADAGIYVGQTRQILVRNNEVHENVIGIQLENTHDGEIVDNYAWNNTAGILVGALPNLPVKDGRRYKIHQNLIEDNNHPNFGDSTAIIGQVPAGLGIVVMAGKEVEIHDNIIRENDSAGAFVLSRDSVDIGYDDPDYDPDSDTVWIRDNVFEENGAQARDQLVAVAVGVNERDDDFSLADIVWDGVVPEAWDADSPPLCITDNGDASFLDFDLPNTFAGASRDLGPHDCAFSPVEL